MAESVRCPRCGYDLRAVVAQWSTSCPLVGPCSECGVEIDWGATFNPDLFGPRWWIETTPPQRGRLHTAVRTLGRLALPVRFWREIDLGQPWRGGRWAVVFLLTLLLGLAPLMIAHGATAWRVWSEVSGPTAVDRVHPMHWQSYGLPPQPNLITPTVNQSREAYLLEALLVPFAGESSGTVTYPVASGRWFHRAPTRSGQRLPAPTIEPLPAPREILALAVREPLRQGRGTGGWRYGALASGMASQWICVAALMPFLFALLPASCRAARVRARHLVRASVTSMWFLLVVVGGPILVVLALYDNHGLDQADLLGAIGELAGVLAPVWLLAYWREVVGTYLRMRHAWGVALLLLVLAALLIALARYVSGGDPWCLMYYLDPFFIDEAWSPPG